MSGPRTFHSGRRGAMGFVLFLLILLPVARGQVVITEVLSFGSTVLVGGIPLKSPDFWEMTNYGRETVDLTGYRFNDSQGGLFAADGSPFVGLTLTPGESLLVVKSLDPTLEGQKRTAGLFRSIWAIPDSTQVTVYPCSNGLSSFGDEVRLWSSPNGELMDAVQFGPGSEGRTFTRDPETGRFGVLSVIGVDGAYRASIRPEIGSPGIAPRRIPMRITRQPQSASVNPGDAVLFEVAFVGLPVPKCRWYHNTPGNVVGTGETLEVPEATAGDEGTYWAVIDDGLSAVTSDSATLRLNQQPSAPNFVKSGADLAEFEGQQALFEVIATGLPRPNLQWFFEGVEIVGGVERRLVLPEVRSGDAGRYTVVASNSMGSATNEMHLVVGRPPRLKITEVMALSYTNRVVDGHGDWWELTNFDDHPVDLYGYRFSTMNGTSPPS